jgi:hypothetical protein
MPEKRVISAVGVFIFKYARYERQDLLISKEKWVMGVWLSVLVYSVLQTNRFSSTEKLLTKRPND